MVEYNVPGSVDIDLYIGFEFEPDLTTYHHKSSSTTNAVESITLEPPWGYEYGQMYVRAYCVSGSDSYYVRAYYIADENGAYRTADEIETPTNGEAPITVSGNLSHMDYNDYYKMYLYSGQNITISGYSTPDAVYSHGIDMYLLFENQTQAGHDWTGLLLDIHFLIEIYSDGWYYLQFDYRDDIGGVHYYTVDISDDNPDPDNRFIGSGVYEMTIPSTYVTNMDSTDYNDYWSFVVSSGEYIEIEVTFLESLDSPYYNAYVYPGNVFPKCAVDLVNATEGTTLQISFCSGEEGTFEVDPGYAVTFYLRIWNEALCQGASDSSSFYQVSFDRGWLNDNDRAFTAPDYTLYGNDTTMKYGDVSSEWDVNDFFKITTYAGYHIRIVVDETSDIPWPHLEGFLYDNSGILLASDGTDNITISYIAPYTGNYYFRIYEGAAEFLIRYTGSSSYQWMIYTSSLDDSNDEVGGAETIVTPFSLNGDISSDDISDYYQFNVPIGYEISITGSSTELLYILLYDEDMAIENIDAGFDWSITDINRKCNFQTFTLLINNTFDSIVAMYSLSIQVNQIDSDGVINGANQIPITTTGSEQGDDSLSFSDIRDYHYFSTEINHDINITVEGINGMIVSVVQVVSTIETVFDTETITGGNKVEFIFNSNDSLTTDYKFYLRICNPTGLYAGDYQWSVILELHEESQTPSPTSITTPTTDPNGLVWWIWLLIIGGSVAITAAIATTVVISLKKKNK